MIFTALGDLVAPRVCAVCGRDLALRERYLCIECEADLPFTYYWTSRDNDMARLMNARVQSGVRDGLWEPFVEACALLFYRGESPYKNIPWMLKYRSDLRLGRHFARMLGERMVEGGRFQDVDLVVPVPLHPLRRFMRGYNQSEVIASELAGVLGAELGAGALKRIRRTATQTRMSVEEKEKNVRGAFRAVPRRLAGARHILLVDDTFTTGATLYACYAAVRSCVPSSVRISVATLSCVSR